MNAQPQRKIDALLQDLDLALFKRPRPHDEFIFSNLAKEFDYLFHQLNKRDLMAGAYAALAMQHTSDTEQALPYIETVRSLMTEKTPDKVRYEIDITHAALLNASGRNLEALQLIAPHESDWLEFHPVIMAILFEHGLWRSIRDVQAKIGSLICLYSFFLLVKNQDHELLKEIVLKTDQFIPFTQPEINLDGLIGHLEKIAIVSQPAKKQLSQNEQHWIQRLKDTLEVAFDSEPPTQEAELYGQPLICNKLSQNEWMCSQLEAPHYKGYGKSPDEARQDLKAFIDSAPDNFSAFSSAPPLDPSEEPFIDKGYKTLYSPVSGLFFEA